jgi:hypothetical protein
MGGVHTSANDYAHWVAFLLSAWPPRDGPQAGPTSRAVVRELAVGTSFPRLGSRPRPDEGPCAFSTVYGAGLNVVRDCDLGLVLTHNGGYPGYGSAMLLMPEYGIGVFAFVNRTYGAPTAAVFDAAQMLKKAGLLRKRPLPVSPDLARAYEQAGTMFRAGDMTASDDLAVNVLLDRSAENWSLEFRRLKGLVGDCAAREPMTAAGLLEGDFVWRCERGSIQGVIALSPTDPPRIQTLKLDAKPDAAPAPASERGAAS